MSLREYRGDIAAQILAGLAANPSIIQSNARNGWDLVNCTKADLVNLALQLANGFLVGNATWPLPQDPTEKAGVET